MPRCSRTTASSPTSAASPTPIARVRSSGDPAHAGHGAQGPPLRVDRGAERLARALGGALGGAAHPRAQEAPGAGDVPGGKAAPASPLPLERFRYFRQETRTVDDAGLVQVDALATTPRCPQRCTREVTVRIYEREIEILDANGTVLRRHRQVRAQRAIRAARGRSHLQPLARDRAADRQGAQDRAALRAARAARSSPASAARARRRSTASPICTRHHSA